MFPREKSPLSLKIRSATRFRMVVTSETTVLTLKFRIDHDPAAIAISATQHPDAPSRFAGNAIVKEPLAQ
jgi:hypothetical protein